MHFREGDASTAKEELITFEGEAVEMLLCDFDKGRLIFRHKDSVAGGPRPQVRRR